MAASIVLDLRGHSTWDPGRLTAEAFRWPSGAPAGALGNVVSRLTPRSFANAGTPVITPASINPATGGVRRRSHKYQGASYQVGSELRPGDVLTPRSSRGVVLLVSEQLAGAVVSSSFFALRPTNDFTGLWVWAVLNSLSGRELRQSLAHGSTASSLALINLLDAPLPQPSLADQQRLTDALLELEAGTHIAEEEAAETWWRTADLRGTEWRLMLASPQPELLLEGVPLRDLCDEIVRGRPVRDVAVGAEDVGLLAVADIGVLGGKKPRRWVPVDAPRLTPVHEGDLCLAAVGERPHASVAQTDAVADPNVFVLRLRDPKLGPPLARYLNGQEGFALRRMMLGGSVIPGLRRRDLGRLPVRKEALDSDKHSEASVVELELAERLEQTLWSR